MTPKSFADEIRKGAVWSRSEAGLTRGTELGDAYESGFEAGARWCLTSEVVSAMRDAIRGSLGWFALMGESELHREKWPAYVRKCEEALAAFEAARGEK